ncbi:hypothetical protein PINS_up008920 [Pythium insidiosum]|nr:hypothetical protein PINS_up008920 [Pythium insidiosum]
MESYGPRPTGPRGASHPYAAGGAPDLRARPMYGIDEEVWLAHHYGPNAGRSGRVPNRYYGMNVAEERAEREQERIERLKKHYKMSSTAGYFMRRDERLRKQAAEKAEQRKREGKPEEEEDADHLNRCVIA